MVQSLIQKVLSVFVKDREMQQLLIHIKIYETARKMIKQFMPS